MFASKPHFLDADPSYRDNVTGMKPNRDLHDSYLDVEPITGQLPYIYYYVCLSMCMDMCIYMYMYMYMYINITHTEYTCIHNVYTCIHASITKYGMCM